MFALCYKRTSDEKHADIMLHPHALKDDGRDNAGTDCNGFTLFRRTRVRLRNGMSPPAQDYLRYYEHLIGPSPVGDQTTTQSNQSEIMLDGAAAFLRNFDRSAPRRSGPAKS
jgi:hypothetical protein